MSSRLDGVKTRYDVAVDEFVHNAEYETEEFEAVADTLIRSGKADEVVSITPTPYRNSHIQEQRPDYVFSAIVAISAAMIVGSVMLASFGSAILWAVIAYVFVIKRRAARK